MKLAIKLEIPEVQRIKKLFQNYFCQLCGQINFTLSSVVKLEKKRTPRNDWRRGGAKQEGLGPGPRLGTKSR